MKTQFLVCAVMLISALGFTNFSFAQMVTANLKSGKTISGEILAMSTSEVSVDPIGSVALLVINASDISSLTFSKTNKTLFFPISEDQIPPAYKTKKNFSQGPAVEDNITRINVTIVGLSVTSEFKLGSSGTLFTEGGVNTFARVQSYTGNNAGKDEYTFSAHPYLQVEPRFYYNLKKRENKGKNTRYNHGGFVALTGGYFFKSLNQDRFELDNRYFVGPVWGAQVFVKSRFTFEARLGLAYLGGTPPPPQSRYVVENNQKALFIADLRFGIMLNKKKS